VNGTAGTCTANLASGSECTISCNEGYWPSQATSCSNGDLSAGTCDAVMSGQFTLNIPFNVFSVEHIGTLHKNAFVKATAEITNLQEHQISVTQTSAGTAADSTAFDFECLGGITEILHAMRVLTLSNGATNFANFKIHYEYAAAIVGVDIAGITLSVTITQAVTRTRWARPSSPSGPSGPTPTPPAPPPDGTSIITQDISITTVTLAQYTGDVKRVYEHAYQCALGECNPDGTLVPSSLGSVTSSAQAARRAGIKITFVATLQPGALKDLESIQAATTLLETDVTGFINGIATANQALGTSVTAPAASDVTAAAPVTQTYSSSNSSNSSSGPNVGMIVGIVIGVLALIGIGAGVAYYFYQNRVNNDERPVNETKEAPGVVLQMGDDPVTTDESAPPAADDDAPPPGGVFKKNGVWMDENMNPIKAFIRGPFM